VVSVTVNASVRQSTSTLAALISTRKSFGEGYATHTTWRRAKKEIGIQRQLLDKGLSAQSLSREKH
jgi:hypothetical protein